MADQINTSGQKRVGLALGGGVVRGMAHIGVLAVLERAGIKLDLVAGSSAGALIGAAFCAGQTSAQLKNFAGRMNWFKLMRPVWPAKGLVSFERIETWFTREVGDLTFDRLSIPLAIVATDIHTGEEIVIKDGRVAPAVRASTSVPGFITPLQIDGRLLCDGSLSNSLPVSVARAMGADYVIAVDVFQPSMRRGWGALGYGAAGLEIVIQRAGGGIFNADCLIAPELSGATYLRFSKREALYQSGVQAAEKALPSILCSLGME